MKIYTRRYMSNGIKLFAFVLCTLLTISCSSGKQEDKQNEKTPPPTVIADDLIPDAFSFKPITIGDRSAAVLGQDYEANTTIKGINKPVSISITGGLYKIGIDGIYTDAGDYVKSGDVIFVIITASTAPLTDTTLTLTVNKTPAVFSVTTKADDIPPLVTVNAPPTTGDITGNKIDLSGVASDAQSGIASVVGTVNGGAIINATFGEDDSWVLELPVSIGDNTVVVTVTDNNGIQTVNEPITVSKVDDLAPTLTVTPFPVDEPIMGGNITVSGSAIDMHSGVASVSLIINDQTDQEKTVTLTPVANTITYWSTAALPINIGVNKVTVYTTDAVGNKSATQTLTIYRADDLAPLLTIVTPTAAQSVDAAGIVVMGTASDAHSAIDSVIVINNDAAPVTATLTSATAVWTTNPETPIALSIGQNTITVKATDTAGVTTTKTVTVIKPDNAPPVLTIIAPDSSETTAESVTITGTVRDEHSGLPGLTIAVNIGASTTMATIKNDGTWSASVPIAVGVNIINVIATDILANNSASQSVSVTKVKDLFTVQGVITALPYSDVDSDINDPYAPFTSNNGDTPDDVQNISNPIKINGFASLFGTLEFRRGDRFYITGDQEDHFRVNLKERDFVSLFIEDDTDADLDLYLYKESTMELVSYSVNPTKLDSLRVKSDGTYIIVVQAYSGATNYLLKVGRSSFLSGIEALGHTTDFEDDQVILRMRDSFVDTVSTDWYPDRAQLRTSHRQADRAMLARINPLNPQTHNMLWGNMVGSGFSHRLSNINPKSARKLKTIKAVKHLSQQAGIAYAEPNYRIKSMLASTNEIAASQWHLHKLNMTEAWDLTTGEPEVVIAIIDTGIYLEHPDLKNQLVPGYDFIRCKDETTEDGCSNTGDGNDIDPDPSDPGGSSWHGSHVARIAAGEMGTGIVGVAPNVKIMPLRAGSDTFDAYNILQAVRYAGGLENDSGDMPTKVADVINLSLGGEGHSKAAQELYSEIREKGIIIVASSGNDNTDEVMYPASYDGVTSVGATEISGKRAYYSNTGASLDVMAYGGHGYSPDELNKRVFTPSLPVFNLRESDNPHGIFSTSISTTDEENAIYLSGTSMSAPQVSAIAALMKSIYPDLTPDIFDSLLFSGKLTKDKDVIGRDDEYGYGVIDGFKAVNAAQQLQNGGVTSAITSNVSTLIFDGLTSELLLSVKPIGNGPIAVTNATASEPWVNIIEHNIDSNGFGEYKISIKEHEFSDGIHVAKIGFKTDTDTILHVEVVVRAGDANLIGNAGFLYILLIDTDSDTSYQIDMAAVDGLYEYQFKDIPMGHYLIRAGSDINNDLSVCGSGETCGSYPDVFSTETFLLIDDMTGLDFSAGSYSSIDLLSIQSLLNTQNRIKKNKQ